MNPSKRRRIAAFNKNLRASKELTLQTEQQEQEKQLPNGLKELTEEVKVEEKPKRLFGRPKKDKTEEAQVVEVVLETKEEQEDKISE